MAKYLDDTGLSYLWTNLKEKLAGKQDKLTGTQGQVVGFGDDGKPVAQDAAKPKCVTVTLSASGWDSTAKTQTVTATGVLAYETAQLIQPTPAITSQNAYYESGILCTGQAEDSLTFTATTVPTEDLTVYVVIQDVVPPSPLPKIYGAVWNGTSTTSWTRTDDAATFSNPEPAVNNGTGSSPFDNCYPWSGMVRVSDPEAGELVAIPKFWYKWTQVGTSIKLQIAEQAVDGFFVSPAHADRGDGKGERDVVYVGRYHCASGYKSTTGVAQQVSITRSTARTNIHNLGTTIWQFDLAMRQTIQMLYLVEFADWDSQTKIGYGCSASGSKVNNGQTDAMQYHTGTTAANRTTYGFTQYRYIEGLWNDVYDWMDGCYYNSNGLNIIMNPNNFSDSANGTVVGIPSSGYPTAMSVAVVSGVQWMYPTRANGSDTTYISDYWNFNASYPCLLCGGYYDQGLDRGLFYVSYSGASFADVFIGCRLQKLP